MSGKDKERDRRICSAIQLPQACPPHRHAREITKCGCRTRSNGFSAYLLECSWSVGGGLVKAGLLSRCRNASHHAEEGHTERDRGPSIERSGVLGRTGSCHTHSVAVARPAHTSTATQHRGRRVPIRYPRAWIRAQRTDWIQSYPGEFSSVPRSRRGHGSVVIRRSGWPHMSSSRHRRCMLSLPSDPGSVLAGSVRDVDDNVPVGLLAADPNPERARLANPYGERGLALERAGELDLSE
jgi:hypothetical protein